MTDDKNISQTFMRAVSLVSRLNDNFLELGSLLRQLYDTAPEDFASIAKIRALGKRKAYYLVQIDRAFAELNVPQARLNAIGWSKLAVIAPVVDRDNVEQWLTKAEKYDAENLKATVRGKPPVNNVRLILLRFSPAQFSTFVKAILAHGARRRGGGFVDKELALTSALRKALGEKTW